ncbi:transcriptional regulator, GntR family [Actinacidiphila yanglinensis]|uniref:Transcriptional regulator, GntR family n=1 Tax=Actinacidiphila yanglinensis TaxID=310779 RepID=A0A1H6DTS3_9ACTN|nr:winged helix-turn-helix domain-containing protein [Actinacidiphila yanglinensis]SEG88681.1 transcriptional regulator, GntR family [Actinacidiphila yanglinensis]
MADEPVSPADSRPPYLHIADVLRGEIDDGRYRVGERIPSQAELEERFDVSRPTVQRALKELRREGYIDNQRGRAAEVQARHARGRAAGTEEPERAFAALDAHVAAAFEQRDVVIDTFSLTTETLNSALSQQLQRVRLGELRPSSITLRVLLPSTDAALAFPRMVADADDPRPLRRLRLLINAHVTALRSTFNGLSVINPDLRSSIEFRSLPITPLFKLYLLNHDTALHGLYRVVPRVVSFDDDGGAPVGEGEIYDVLGISATLFPYRRDPDEPKSRDTRFVQESQDWFDSVWTTIAGPLILGD